MKFKINVIVTRFFFSLSLSLFSLHFHNVSNWKYKKIFFFFLSFFLFVFSEQISFSQVYLIRCQNHMSEAIREEKRKITYLKSAQILMLEINDTTFQRMYVRDYKSNENTIYSKRSKSFWLIKWVDEKKAHIYDRKIFLPNKMLPFYD